MEIHAMFRKVDKEEPINTFLRKKKHIVYGARAMNQQLPLHLQRPTDDYDVYSKTPKKSARNMEKHLDKHYGGDYYYVKPALHPGTYKVVDRGQDKKPNTEDDYPVVDYTKPTRKIRHIERKGIRYARLSERRKDIKKSLADKESAYRHEKDKRDMQRIKNKSIIMNFIRR